MASQFPSIQSFFTATKPNLTPLAHASKNASSDIGDGFTADEVHAVLHPVTDENWLPSQDYEEADIADLIPGPRCITFRGRVANFYDQATTSKMPRAAKGCIKIIVKDDTGCITVRLWYAKVEYQLRLGQLVTIWTPHVSNGEHVNLNTNQAPLFTSIFPERDRSCHFLIHQNSDNGEQCKKPLGYRRNKPLDGLMTLKNFVDGGYDCANAKLLVCVKSIGAKKKITPKSGKSPPNDCVSVQIFDSTQSAATLSSWGAMTATASSWQPSKTVLLITSPGWNINRATYISLTSSTIVDVDPDIPDVAWLRNFAARLTRRQDVSPVFPSKEQLDIEAALEAPNQILFTFATLDEFARAAPSEKFVGWLSVLLTEINLSLLHRRNMLLCAMHCGVPIYANSAVATCKQCSAMVDLRLNPRILGPVIDETGCSQAGKLFLSDVAWAQLLGLTKNELCKVSNEELRFMEQRMLYMRVHLGVAWWAEEADVGVGRVWVWAVRC